MVERQPNAFILITVSVVVTLAAVFLVLRFLPESSPSPTLMTPAVFSPSPLPATPAAPAVASPPTLETLVRQNLSGIHSALRSLH